MTSAPGPRTESRQRGSGARLLLIGAALIVVGLVIVLLVGGGTAEGIGWAVVALGCVPAVAGIALTGSALVARRSREDKPWA